MINDICTKAHEAAVSKGFYERERKLPELLMLIVSELSEAMEAERNGRQVELFRQYWAKDYANTEEWQKPGNIVGLFEQDMRHTIEDGNSRRMYPYI